MKYQIINGAITFGNNTILEEINFTINKKDPNMSDKLVRKQCGIEALKLLEIHEEMKTW